MSGPKGFGFLGDFWARMTGYVPQPPRKHPQPRFSAEVVRAIKLLPFQNVVNVDQAHCRIGKVRPRSLPVARAAEAYRDALRTQQQTADTNPCDAKMLSTVDVIYYT